MAVYYIDLVSGNDAADGTSWGTAWKTFQNGATAARIAPGDEIRCSETSAPSSVGTATWTSGKVGNSITFASAPTKQVDTCKAGWVTLGAGSTVTNTQTTAYVTPTTFGGTTMGALQITTSAAANLGYKALGSTQDFSAHQQISFWFRTSATFDCSGAQNMTITFCSDAAGVTAVDSFVMPKWTYAANMWYPIVIDKGSAAGSSIQSVAIRTTSNTTQTFYFDEMFASPASGLTLWSLIGLNDGNWHSIRTIRGADVQLMAGANFTLAAGAYGIIHQIDASWMGTTTTATTYKLEPSRALLPTTGPAANGGGVTMMDSGTVSSPIIFRGGWNTSSGLQTGVTFLDNVTHSSSSVGLNFAATPAYIIVENFGIVRYAQSMATNVTNWVTKDISVIATLGTTNSNQAAFGFLTAVAALGYTSLGWKQFSGCYNMPSYGFGSYIADGLSYNIGHIWGSSTNGSGVSLSSMYNTTVNIGNFYPALSGSSSILSVSCTNCKVNVGDYKSCNSNQSTGTLNWMSLTGSNNAIKFNNVNMPYLYTTSTWSGSNNVITAQSFTSAGGTVAACSVGGQNNVLYIKSASISSTMLIGSNDTKNHKIYFHNYNGLTNYFRAYVVDGNTTANGYFELQSTDVYTSGSKAIRNNTSSFISGSSGLNTRFDLKLASAAAEANKLVTITARVKRNTTNTMAGIYIPGFSETVPGYTADIIESCSSTGTYELLTITFTPTDACVFDVMAYFKPTAACSVDIVWDTLTISQAA